MTAGGMILGYGPGLNLMCGYGWMVAELLEL